MSRPYSFRYPGEVRTVLEPWRKKLSDAMGGGSFDSIVAQLTERDRAIEDYLSLGVSQGHLGVGFGASMSLTGTTFADIGIEVTFTVPAGRQIKMMFGTCIRNLDSSRDISEIRALDQDDNLLAFASDEHAGFFDLDDINSSVKYYQVFFQQPAAGTHTWRLQARMTVNGSGEITSAWGDTHYLAIEDIGPIGR